MLFREVTAVYFVGDMEQGYILWTKFKGPAKPGL
jgi:hypothetical protein